MLPENFPMPLNRPLGELQPRTETGDSPENNPQLHLVVVQLTRFKATLGEAEDALVTERNPQNRVLLKSRLDQIRAEVDDFLRKVAQEPMDGLEETSLFARTQALMDRLRQQAWHASLYEGVEHARRLRDDRYGKAGELLDHYSNEVTTCRRILTEGLTEHLYDGLSTICNPEKGEVLEIPGWVNRIRGRLAKRGLIATDTAGEVPLGGIEESTGVALREGPDEGLRAELGGDDPEDPLLLGYLRSGNPDEEPTEPLDNHDLDEVIIALPAEEEGDPDAWPELNANLLQPLFPAIEQPSSVARVRIPPDPHLRARNASAPSRRTPRLPQATPPLRKISGALASVLKSSRLRFAVLALGILGVAPQNDAGSSRDNPNLEAASDQDFVSLAAPLPSPAGQREATLIMSPRAPETDTGIPAWELSEDDVVQQALAQNGGRLSVAALKKALADATPTEVLDGLFDKGYQVSGAGLSAIEAGASAESLRADAALARPPAPAAHLQEVTQSVSPADGATKDAQPTASRAEVSAPSAAAPVVLPGGRRVNVDTFWGSVYARNLASGSAVGPATVHATNLTVNAALLAERDGLLQEAIHRGYAPDRCETWADARHRFGEWGGYDNLIVAAEVETSQSAPSPSCTTFADFLNISGRHVDSSMVDAIELSYVSTLTPEAMARLQKKV